MKQRYSKLKKYITAFVIIILAKKLTWGLSIKWNDLHKDNNALKLNFNFNFKFQLNCTSFFVNLTKHIKTNYRSVHKCKKTYVNYFSPYKSRSNILKNKKLVITFLNGKGKGKRIRNNQNDIIRLRTLPKKQNVYIICNKKTGLNKGIIFLENDRWTKVKTLLLHHKVDHEKEIEKKKGKERNDDNEDKINENNVTSVSTSVDTSNRKKQNNEKKKGKKNENEIINRTFLTDTKYYKRSKYSKAGWIKKNEKEYMKIGENYFLDTFLTDQYAGEKGFYTESIEDLPKKSFVSTEKKTNENLSDILLKSYFTDKHKMNTLDLIHQEHYANNDMSNTTELINETYHLLSPNENIKVNEQRETMMIPEKETKDANKINQSMNNMEIKIENKTHTIKSEKTDNKKIDFMNEFTVIGEIVGIYGLAGFVKVVSFTTFNNIRFQNNCYRYIFMNNYPYPLPIKIEQIKESLKINFLYVKFYNINSRTDAMKLQNCLICCDKRDFPKLEENQYISTDLLNFDIYIFNDFSNTCIGQIKDFLSKHDYIPSKVIQAVADDLIKIQINKKLSLKKVFHIINLSKKKGENKVEMEDLQLQNMKSVQVLINKNNFNLYETNPYEFDTSSDTVDKKKEEQVWDNLDGFSYKKIFKCDYCNCVFENIKEASEHENSHFQTEENNVLDLENVNENKEKIYEVTEETADKVKNVECFFIPIIKEKTIRLVQYELKKIYLDISTIFLVDNQK